MARRFVLSIAASLLFASTTFADAIIEWDGLNDAFQEASFLAPGVGNVNLTRGPGIAQASGSNFISDGFFVGGNLQDAINEGDYLSFGFTVDAGNNVDIEDIMVELNRSATGPSVVNLFSDITGFGGLSVIETQSVPSSGGSVLTFDLSGNANFQDVTGSVEFRLVFNGATFSTGTVGIEDDLIGGDSGQVGLQINGTSAVPEPASCALVGFMAVGGLAFMRRRKR